jgi:glutamate carboxypeptidase
VRTIERWLRSQETRLLELLEQLVTTESHASHPEGVAEVAGTIINELSPLGFEFTTTASPPLPPEDHWLEDVFSPGVPYHQLGSSYSALAAGSATGKVLMLGDLDTAFPTGTLEAFPFRVEGGKAYGPGIADMKAGLVVMVAALQTLVELGLDRPKIALVLAGDEQAGSLGSRRVIEQVGLDARWCLCVECARRGGKLMGARGHIGVGSVVVSGSEAHTGSAPGAGTNALNALARLILEFDNLSDPAAGALVTVTLAQGGRRRSVVPASAHGTIDIRTSNASQWKTITDRMNQIATEVAVDTGARIDLQTHCHRPGIQWDQGTDGLLEIARRVGSELGVEIDAFESAAAGSSAFRPGGIPTLDGLGPEGANLMTHDEHVVVNSLVPRAALLAGIVTNLRAS